MGDKPLCPTCQSEIDKHLCAFCGEEIKDKRRKEFCSADCASALMQIKEFGGYYGWAEFQFINDYWPKPPKQESEEEHQPMAHPTDLDPNNPTGQRYAENFCDEHDIDRELWGHINNVALDGYHAGRDEIRPLVEALRAQAEIERKNKSTSQQTHVTADAYDVAAEALFSMLRHHLGAAEALAKAIIEKEESKSVLFR